MPADNQLRSEAEARGQLIEDVHYDLRLHLSDDLAQPTYLSRTLIDFHCRSAGADTFVNLRAPEVRRVSLNGLSLSADEHHFDGSRLSIRGLRDGPNQLEVLADCAYQRSGVGLHRFGDPQDGAAYVYSHFEPFDAHRMLACFDQPDLKAPLTLHVTAPAHWRVCSGGALRECVDEDGQRRWDFHATPPLPPYLFAVAAGEFELIEAPSHRDIPLRLYARRALSAQLHAESDEIFDITRRAIAYFERRYGYTYPFATYSQVFVPEASMGAMENPGCVTFNELYLFRGPVTETQRMRRTNVILHEMVHVMGFGDVVTMRDWGDLWLNETFATVEATIAQAALGAEHAWVDFAGSVKSRALVQDQLSTTHPILVDAVDTNAIRPNFDGITYQKGASVLRQLVSWVGEEPFVDGIREYFRAFFWGNATRADFLEHQADASGRDLHEWSQMWLEQPGVNTLRPEATVDGGRYVTLAVRQEADAVQGSLRPHRIRVALYRDRQGTLQRERAVEIDVTAGRTEVPPFAGEPQADVVLVNDADLTFAKVRFDDASRERLLGTPGVSSMSDPVSRAVCWTSLWDSTRDAEIAAHRFVDAVLSQASDEGSTVLLERILAEAVAVATQYSGGERHLTALHSITEVAQRQLLDASPAARLIWMRCLGAAARDERALTFIDSLLEGSATVEGLTLDPELRWFLVARLATAGRAGQSRIEAELELDPSDAGHRRALSCRAVLPDADAKAQAWSLAIEQRSLSRARLAALLGGFGSGLFTAGGFHGGGVEQQALTRPFLTPYLEVLPALWREREYEEARTLTEALFPHHQADVETISAVKAAIAAEQLPWTGQRLLMEGRDSLVRTARARLADEASGGDGSSPRASAQPAASASRSESA